MPVPTENFWNIKKLNIAFFFAAVLLFVGTQLFVIKDYWRDWRRYQRQARVWKTAMTRDALLLTDTPAVSAQIDQIQKQINIMQKQLPHEKIAQLEQEQRDAIREQNKRTLKLAVVKGKIAPKTQQVERATLAFGADHPKTLKLKRQLKKILSQYQGQYAQMSALTIKIAQIGKDLRRMRSKVDKMKKRMSALTDRKKALLEKLAKFDPQGVHEIDETVRNLPLLDWMNPSEKVHQVVIPDVRSDFNFVQTETIDRCSTCHVNIDNPSFEPKTLLSFVERQLAMAQGQDVDQLGNLKPVVLLDFWTAVGHRGTPVLQRAVDAVRHQALKRLNALREEADLKPLKDVDEIVPELTRLTRRHAGVTTPEDFRKWYAQARYYLKDLKASLKKVLGKREYHKLEEMYRRLAIRKVNALRRKQGLALLSDDPVLMGHPRMDLFVEVQSKHPMKTMGCTVCHEGAGQETDFTHATHRPRDMWVDAQTGGAVPDMLVGHRVGTANQIARLLRGQASVTLGSHSKSSKSVSESISTVSSGDHDMEEDSKHSEEGGGHAISAGQAHYTHADLNLNDPADAAPFSPEHQPHGDTAAYRDPVTGRLHKAIKQAAYWSQKYHWHEVGYTHWERPMHKLDYVESGCARCHTKIFDIRDEAPQLFEGRKLFAQYGCANCHAVKALETAKDIKRVGPSLRYVSQKLSPKMMASWIWAPKAFRPSTRMPQYFMLENNSTPVDILRTRVEVAAITHYLQTARPSATADVYKPVAPPAKAGNIEAGRKLFKTVGCLACHANMAEFGQQWITSDLMQRKGWTLSQAQSKYDAMTYNQRQWYAMEHLEKKFSRVGPELSGVGTKLKTGRTLQEARQWLYNWLRQPRHYSSYTVMPSFRLDPTQANDLTAYLLSLERPDYQAQDFMNLDAQSKQMLLKLVASLKVGQLTPEASLQRVKQSMSTSDQLAYLGKKMITNYGCNGCHEINGFETAPSACTNLNGWGFKDPHKIDFGYFNHAFDKQRGKPLVVTKVDHEGLEADAPQIRPDSAKINPQKLLWEHIPADRRDWLYQKLHNPRLFDRGRSAFDGKLGEDNNVDIGRPYDKLKMPKFFLQDHEVRALVTYVTSIRPSLVSKQMLAATYPSERKRVAMGRQIATKFNCYGCHNIEGNQTTVSQYFKTHNPDGTFNQDNLNWAPPRLIGQGAKTQPDWLFSFLQNVQPIRPWLQIRMPSFPLQPEDATTIVDYFAGHTQMLGQELGEILASLDKFLAKAPKADWYDVESLKTVVAKLNDFAIRADLATPDSLDPKKTDPQTRRDNYKTLLAKVRLLAQTYQTDYPYVKHYWPDPDPAQLVRGERLFSQMGCMAGACHRVGDDRLLAKEGLLVGQVQPDDDTAASEDDGYGDDSEADDSADASEDDGYGDDDEADADASEEGKIPVLASIAPQKAPEGAPNLIHVANRLQDRWVRQWVQHATVIQPGTRMQEFWAHGDSFFKPFPAKIRQAKESLFGYTAQQQRDLIVQFLYAVGPRHITYKPDGSRLGVSADQSALIKLKALTPQKKTSTTKTPSPAPHASRAASPVPPVRSTSPKTSAAAKPVTLQSSLPRFPATSVIKLQTQPEISWKGTRIVGVVHYKGKAVKRKKIRMGSDQTCQRFYKSAGTVARREDLIVTKENTLQNAFIYVKKGLSGKQTPPQQPAIIDQVGCMYHPHVLGVMTGQPVKIINSDPTLHNVNCKSKKNAKFNNGMPVKGMVINKVFNKVELNIPLKCDVHAWMKGVIHVVDNPYFAVSDVQGRFEIKGLPPGQYTLEAIHENRRIKPVTFQVTVKADTSVLADVTLKR